MANEFIYRCETCRHTDQETANDVSCCNVCGEKFGDEIMDCYEPISDEQADYEASMTGSIDLPDDYDGAGEQFPDDVIDYPEEYQDDSDRSCKDCPPEECTGRCFGCYYRTV